MPDWVCRTCGEWTGDGRGGDGPPSFCRCDRERIRSSGEPIPPETQRAMTNSERAAPEPRRPIPPPPPPQVTKKCYICGSDDVATEIAARSGQVPLGPEIFYRAVEDTCRNCGETGDFNRENDFRIEAAYLESGVRFVRETLAWFESEGTSMVEIDRCLRMKIGTCGKWAQGKSITAEAVALMQILKTFPWLLNVADNDFSDADGEIAKMLREHLLIDVPQ